MKERNHMYDEFINLTEENLADEHLCCIIRTRKKHPGVALVIRNMTHSCRVPYTMIETKTEDYIYG